jgi:FHA domain
MLRFELSDGDVALPPIDIAVGIADGLAAGIAVDLVDRLAAGLRGGLGDGAVVIGSAPSARIRLPVDEARPEHVRIEGQSWTLLAEARIGGMLRAAGDSGPLGHGVTFELGRYRVRVGIAPPGACPSPPQRTESLARELARSLLGDGAAPWLEIERGVGAGARRALAPPESTLVIGRGDEASWVILDEDLSRTHAEIRRGWDGVSAVDLGSKNGTRVDGQAIARSGSRSVGGAIARSGSRGGSRSGSREPVELRDGATLTLGRVVLRFHDPAERHLRGEPPNALPPGPRAQSPAPVTAPRPPGRLPMLAFVAYTTLAVLALAASIWILAS